MTDIRAIERVVESYMISWYHGDHATMADCLHPALIKRRLARDREGGMAYLNCLHRDEMIAATEAGLGVRHAATFSGVEVSVFAVAGDVASARAVSGQWIDFLHLVRWEGRWVIANCLYAPAPQE